MPLTDRKLPGSKPIPAASLTIFFSKRVFFPNSNEFKSKAKLSNFNREKIESIH